MNSMLNEFLKTPPQPVASAGAIIHKEQEKRDRMDDLNDSSRVLDSELALPPSLTSNAVDFFKVPFILGQQQQISLFAIITVWHT